MDTKKFRTSIRAKIVLGFGLAILVVITAGVITYQNFHNLIRSLDFLSNPEVKMIKLNDVLSDLSLSESNIRSYFISNEEKYLDRYYQYSDKLEKNIDTLSVLSADSSDNYHRIKTVSDLWKEKKKHTKDLIELYKQKRDRRLPDGILKKLNKENPDVPTITITKTITIRNIDIPKESTKKIDDDPAPQRSFIGRIFSKKDRSKQVADTSKAEYVTMEEVTTLIDTIYTMGDANEVKEQAFSRILSNIRNQNAKSRKMLKDNETEMIRQDIGLIEFIRDIVIELKNDEQKVTQENIREAKEIVEVSVVRIFLFGALGVLLLLVIGFMIMNDIRKNNYHKTQLVNARVQAEELAVAKENFLATMSHEIRTPLNSIIGFTEQLTQTQLQNKQKYFLQAVTRSSNHLMSLVNDILDHSRIEAGKIEFENEPFSVKQVIEEVYETFYIEAVDKNILLTYKISEGEHYISGDSLRLKQILFNLVSNAIKFTEQGSVTIHCDIIPVAENKVNIQMSVKDTGIGIPEKLTGRIFESFSQADSSISRKFGGTGLGLAIVKKLVELQGGTISVKSKEHIGSEFTFTIPYTESTSVRSKFMHTGMDLSRLSGLSVLVVEDDELNLLLFHTILVKWNIKAVIASSGEDAIAILSKDKFDVILTDIHMPGMSGVDFFKKIKTQEIATIPVVAVTANVFKESIHTFKETGFSEVISKPFKEEQLAGILLKVTGRGEMGEHHNGHVSAVVSEPENIFSDFMKFSGNDKQAVRKMVEVFLRNTSAKLTKIEENFQAKKWKELQEVVHQLIPGFGHFKNQEMVQLLAETEIYLLQRENPDEEKLRQMISRILQKGKEQIRILEAEKI